MQLIKDKLEQINTISTIDSWDLFDQSILLKYNYTKLKQSELIEIFNDLIFTYRTTERIDDYIYEDSKESDKHSLYNEKIVLLNNVLEEMMKVINNFSEVFLKLSIYSVEMSNYIINRGVITDSELRILIEKMTSMCQRLERISKNPEKSFKALREKNYVCNKILIIIKDYLKEKKEFKKICENIEEIIDMN